MLKSKKHVFWEALLLTIVVFALGLLMGVAFEGRRVDKINDYYAISEISMMDVLALNDLMSLENTNTNCSTIIDSNLLFADRIYEEARQLERYDTAGKITENIKLAHKKYDLMRTFLWINSMRTFNTCKDQADFNVVVYLYEYETEDLAKKATQNVWSRTLFDLKQEFGEKIVLIPIAADSNLASLDSLLMQYEIEQYPVVIINNKFVLNELTSVDEMEKYLDLD
ncbi:hypothetical protein GF378_01260 [Candidatus Pacearchaeota archaeon]|nr:hypothetical protein [Candidatus Pacearchaeota archaeon]